MYPEDMLQEIVVQGGPLPQKKRAAWEGLTPICSFLVSLKVLKELGPKTDNSLSVAIL